MRRGRAEKEKRVNEKRGEGPMRGEGGMGSLKNEQH